MRDAVSSRSSSLPLFTHLRSSCPSAHVSPSPALCAPASQPPTQPLSPSPAPQCSLSAWRVARSRRRRVYTTSPGWTSWTSRRAALWIPHAIWSHSRPAMLSVAAVSCFAPPCSAAACYPSMLLPPHPLTALDSHMTCSTLLTQPETWSLQSPSQRASGQQSQMGRGRAAVEQHNSNQWSIAFRGVWGSVLQVKSVQYSAWLWVACS